MPVPSINASASMTGTPLPAVPSLSPEAIRKFADEHLDLEGHETVFWSLSHKTHCLLVRAHQKYGVDPYDLVSLVASFSDDIRHSYDDTPQSRRIGELVVRSTLLVMEKIVEEVAHGGNRHPDWVYYAKEAVIGFGDRGFAPRMYPPSITTVEELHKIAGYTSFIMGVVSANDMRSHVHLEKRMYSDPDGRGHSGMGIKNPWLEEFVIKNPDLGYRCGLLAVERSIGKTKEDAGFVVKYFNDAETAPSLSSGVL